MNEVDSKERSEARQIGNKTSGFLVTGIGTVAFALIYQLYLCLQAILTSLQISKYRETRP